MKVSHKQHSSSFRDPSGYIFTDQGIVKRAINPIYFKQYNSLVDTGFFDVLHKKRLLIPHKEIVKSDDQIIIQPEQIPFITYPYEWSFSQFKDAALLTLKLQKYALDKGYSLKDASAFNVTYHNGKPIFVDTLSFDFYINDSPWRAYKQFIEHFLGPLLLARYHGAESLKTLNSFIDGIPIKLIASMLPLKAKLNPFLYSNIHLLAKFENKYNDDYEGKTQSKKLSKKAQYNIVKGLYEYIKKLTLNEASEWGDYYSKTNYENNAFKAKAEIISNWVGTIAAKRLIDVGGNDGTFVRQIGKKIELALVCDIDNNAVDLNYKNVKLNKESHIIPFVMDVLNPSSDIGFNNKERDSFLNRINKFAPDVTLALALIHHMSLTGNIPFKMSANFFAAFSKCLIIEFPKRDDSWVQRLLNSKLDFKEQFEFYNMEGFENAFANYFELIEKRPIDNTSRVLYIFKRK